MRASLTFTLLLLAVFISFPPTMGMKLNSTSQERTKTGTDLRNNAPRNAKTISAGSKELIVPGEGIGSLYLGDPESKFYSLFPDGPLKDFRPTYNVDCGAVLHWVDVDPTHPLSLGVIVLSNKGIITQIEAGMPRFQTKDGISWGSRPRDVKNRYPGLKSYEAVGTTSEAVGGRNLVFWVDTKQGLGFVFAYSRITNDWGVYKVVVFSPTGTFCPEGNVRTPDTWQELAPFSLESPYKRAFFKSNYAKQP